MGTFLKSFDSLLQHSLHGFVLLGALAVNAAPTQAAPVDRHALVTRHNVVPTNFDAANPLSVSNG
jgi:hypothetical protein